MLEVTKKFSKAQRTDFLSMLSTFRNKLEQTYDDPMADSITETANLMKTTYLEILDQFIAGKYYYGPLKDYKELGSRLVIWRIPVGVTQGQWLYSSPPGQNGCRFITVTS